MHAPIRFTIRPGLAAIAALFASALRADQFAWALLQDTPASQTWFSNVPGGHLLKVVQSQGISITFYPDPDGKWKPTPITPIDTIPPRIFDGRNLFVSANGPWSGQVPPTNPPAVPYVIPLDKVLYYERSGMTPNVTRIHLIIGNPIDVIQSIEQIMDATGKYPR